MAHMKIVNLTRGWSRAQICSPFLPDFCQKCSSVLTLMPSAFSKSTVVSYSSYLQVGFLCREVQRKAWHLPLLRQIRKKMVTTPAQEANDFHSVFHKRYRGNCLVQLFYGKKAYILTFLNITHYNVRQWLRSRFYMHVWRKLFIQNVSTCILNFQYPDKLILCFSPQGFWLLGAELSICKLSRTIKKDADVLNPSNYRSNGWKQKTSMRQMLIR